MGNLLRRVLAFVLGMVFTVAAAAGSMVGGAYWAYKNVKPLGIVSDDPGLGDLRDQSVEDLIYLLNGALNDPDTYTLARLEAEYGLDLEKVLRNLGIEKIDKDSSDWQALTAVSLFSLKDGIPALLGTVRLRALYNFLPSLTGKDLNDILSTEAQEKLGDYTLLELIESDELTGETGIFKAIKNLKVGAILPDYFDCEYDEQTHTFNYVLSDSEEAQALPVLGIFGNISLGVISEMINGGDIMYELMEGSLSSVSKMPVEEILTSIAATVSPEIGEKVSSYAKFLNGARLSDMFVKNADGGYDFYYAKVLGNVKVGYVLGLTDEDNDGVWVNGDGEPAEDLLQLVANLSVSSLLEDKSMFEKISAVAGDLSVGMILDMAGIAEGDIPPLDGLRALSVGDLLKGQGESFDADVFVKSLIESLAASLGDKTLGELIFKPGEEPEDANALIKALFDLKVSDFVREEYSVEALLETFRNALGDVTMGDILGTEKNEDGTWKTDDKVLALVLDFSFDNIFDVLSSDYSAKDVISALLPDVTVGELFVAFAGFECDEETGRYYKENGGERDYLSVEISELFDCKLADVAVGLLDKNDPFDSYEVLSKVMIGDLADVVLTYLDTDLDELEYKLDNGIGSYVWQGDETSAASDFLSISVAEFAKDIATGGEELKAKDIDYYIELFGAAGCFVAKKCGYEGDAQGITDAVVSLACDLFDGTLGEPTFSGDNVQVKSVVDTLAEVITIITPDNEELIEKLANLTNELVTHTIADPWFNDYAEVAVVVNDVKEIVNEFIVNDVLNTALDGFAGLYGDTTLENFVEKTKSLDINVVIEYVASVVKKTEVADDDLITDITTLLTDLFAGTIAEFNVEPNLKVAKLTSDVQAIVNKFANNEVINAVFDGFGKLYGESILENFVDTTKALEIHAVLDYVTDVVTKADADIGSTVKDVVNLAKLVVSGTITAPKVNQTAKISEVVDAISPLTEDFSNDILDEVYVQIKALYKDELVKDTAKATKALEIQAVVGSIGKIAKAAKVSEEKGGAIVELVNGLVEGTVGKPIFNDLAKVADVTKDVRAVIDTFAGTESNAIVNAIFGGFAGLYGEEKLKDFVSATKAIEIDSVIDYVASVVNAADVAPESTVADAKELLKTVFAGAIGHAGIDERIVANEFITEVKELVNEFVVNDVLNTALDGLGTLYGESLLKNFIDTTKAIEIDAVIDYVASVVNAADVAPESTVADAKELLKTVFAGTIGHAGIEEKIVANKFITDVKELVNEFVVNDVLNTALVGLGNLYGDSLLKNFVDTTKALEIHAVLDYVNSVVTVVDTEVGATVEDIVTLAKAVVTGTVTAPKVNKDSRVADVIDAAETVFGYIEFANVVTDRIIALSRAALGGTLGNLDFDFDGLVEEAKQIELIVGGTIAAVAGVTMYFVANDTLLNIIDSTLGKDKTVGELLGTTLGYTKNEADGKYYFEDEANGLANLLFEQTVYGMLDDEYDFKGVFYNALNIDDIAMMAKAVVAKYAGESTAVSIVNTVLDAIDGLYPATHVKDFVEATKGLDIDVVVDYVADIINAAAGETPASGARARRKATTTEESGNAVVNAVAKLLKLLLKGALSAPAIDEDVVISDTIDAIEGVTDTFVKNDVLAELYEQLRSLYNGDDAYVKNFVSLSGMLRVKDVVDSISEVIKAATDSAVEDKINAVSEFIQTLVAGEIINVGLNATAQIKDLADKLENIYNKFIGGNDEIDDIVKCLFDSVRSFYPEGSVIKTFVSDTKQIRIDNIIASVANVADVATARKNTAKITAISEFVQSIVAGNLDEMGFDATAKVADVIGKLHGVVSEFVDKSDKKTNDIVDSAFNGIANLYGDATLENFVKASKAIKIADAVDCVANVVKTAVGNEETNAKIDDVVELIKQIVSGTVTDPEVNPSSKTDDTVAAVETVTNLFFTNDILSAVYAELKSLYEDKQLKDFVTDSKNLEIDDVISSVGNIIKATKAIEDSEIDALLAPFKTLVTGTIGAPEFDDKATVSDLTGNVKAIVDVIADTKGDALVNAIFTGFAGLYNGVALKDFVTASKELEIHAVLDYVNSVVTVVDTEVGATVEDIVTLAKLVVTGTVTAPKVNKDSQVADVIDAAETVFGYIEFAKPVTDRIIALSRAALGGTLGNLDFDFKGLVEKATQIELIVGGTIAAVAGVTMYFVANDTLLTIIDSTLGKDKTVGELLGTTLGYTENTDGKYYFEDEANGLANLLFEQTVYGMLDDEFDFKGVFYDALLIDDIAMMAKAVVTKYAGESTAVSAVKTVLSEIDSLYPGTHVKDFGEATRAIEVDDAIGSIGKIIKAAKVVDDGLVDDIAKLLTDVIAGTLGKFSIDPNVPTSTVTKDVKEIVNEFTVNAVINTALDGFGKLYGDSMVKNFVMTTKALLVDDVINYVGSVAIAAEVDKETVTAVTDLLIDVLAGTISQCNVEPNIEVGELTSDVQAIVKKFANNDVLNAAFDGFGKLYEGTYLKDFVETTKALLVDDVISYVGSVAIAAEVDKETVTAVTELLTDVLAGTVTQCNVEPNIEVAELTSDVQAIVKKFANNDVLNAAFDGFGKLYGDTLVKDFVATTKGLKIDSVIEYVESVAIAAKVDEATVTAVAKLLTDVLAGTISAMGIEEALTVNALATDLRAVVDVVAGTKDDALVNAIFKGFVDLYKDTLVKDFVATTKGLKIDSVIEYVESVAIAAKVDEATVTAVAKLLTDVLAGTISAMGIEEALTVNALATDLRAVVDVVAGTKDDALVNAIFKGFVDLYKDTLVKDFVATTKALLVDDVIDYVAHVADAAIGGKSATSGRARRRATTETSNSTINAVANLFKDVFAGTIATIGIESEIKVNELTTDVKGLINEFVVNEVLNTALDGLGNLYGDSLLKNFVDTTKALEVHAVLDYVNSVVNKALGGDTGAIISDVVALAKLVVSGTVSAPEVDDEVKTSDFVDGVKGVTDNFVTNDVLGKVYEEIKALYNGKLLKNIVTDSKDLVVDSVIVSLGNIVKATKALDDSLVDKTTELLKTVFAGTIATIGIESEIKVNELTTDVKGLINEFVVNEVLNTALDGLGNLYGESLLKNFVSTTKALEVHAVLDYVTDVANKADADVGSTVEDIVTLAKAVVTGTVTAPKVNKDSQVADVIDAAETVFGYIEFAKPVTGRVIVLSRAALGGTLGNLDFDFDGLVEKATQTELIVGGAIVAVTGVTLYFVANDTLLNIIDSTLGKDKTVGELLGTTLGYTENTDGKYYFEDEANGLANLLFEQTVYGMLDDEFDFKGVFYDALLIDDIAMMAKAVVTKYAGESTAITTVNTVLDVVDDLYSETHVKDFGEATKALKVDNVINAIGTVIKAVDVLEDTKVDAILAPFKTLLDNTISDPWFDDTAAVSTVVGDVKAIVDAFGENEVVTAIYNEIVSLYGSTMLMNFVKASEALEMNAVIGSIGRIIKAAKVVDDGLVDDIAKLLTDVIAGTLGKFSIDPNVPTSTVTKDVKEIVNEFTVNAVINAALDGLGNLYGDSMVKNFVMTTKALLVDDVISYVGSVAIAAEVDKETVTAVTELLIDVLAGTVTQCNVEPNIEVGELTSDVKAIVNKFASNDVLNAAFDGFGKLYEGTYLKDFAATTKALRVDGIIEYVESVAIAAEVDKETVTAVAKLLTDVLAGPVSDIGIESDLRVNTLTLDIKAVIDVFAENEVLDTALEGFAGLYGDSLVKNFVTTTKALRVHDVLDYVNSVANKALDGDTKAIANDVIALVKTVVTGTITEPVVDEAVKTSDTVAAVEKVTDHFVTNDVHTTVYTELKGLYNGKLLKDFVADSKALYIDDVIVSIGKVVKATKAVEDTTVDAVLAPFKTLLDNTVGDPWFDDTVAVSTVAGDVKGIIELVGENEIVTAVYNEVVALYKTTILKNFVEASKALYIDDVIVSAANIIKVTEVTDGETIDAVTKLLTDVLAGTVTECNVEPNVKVAELTSDVKAIVNKFASNDVLNAVFDGFGKLYKETYLKDFAETTKALEVDAVIDYATDVINTAMGENPATGSRARRKAAATEEGNATVNAVAKLLKLVLKGTITAPAFDDEAAISDTVAAVEGLTDAMEVSNEVLTSVYTELKGLYNGKLLKEFGDASKALEVDSVVGSVGNVVKATKAVEDSTVDAVLAPFKTLIDNTVGDPWFDDLAEVSVVVGDVKTLVNEFIVNEVLNTLFDEVSGLYTDATINGFVNKTTSLKLDAIIGSVGTIAKKATGGEMDTKIGSVVTLAQALVAGTVTEMGIEPKLAIGTLIDDVDGVFDAFIGDNELINTVFTEVKNLYQSITLNGFVDATTSLKLDAIIGSVGTIAKKATGGEMDTKIGSVVTLAQALVAGTVTEMGIEPKLAIGTLIDDVDGVFDAFIGDNELINTVFTEVKNLYQSTTLNGFVDATTSLEADAVIGSVGAIGKAAIGSETDGKIDAIIGLVQTLVGGTIVSVGLDTNAPVKKLAGNVETLYNEFLGGTMTDVDRVVSAIVTSVNALYPTDAHTLETFVVDTQNLDIDNVINEVFAIVAAMVVETGAMEQGMLDPIENIAKYVFTGTLATATLDEQAEVSQIILYTKDLVDAMNIGEAQTFVDKALEQTADLLDGVKLVTIATDVMDVEVKAAIETVRAIFEDVEGIAPITNRAAELADAALSGTFGTLTFDFNALTAAATQTELIIGGVVVAIVGVATYFVANPTFVALVDQMVGGADVTIGDMAAESLGYQLVGGKYLFRDEQNFLANALFNITIHDAVTLGYDFTATLGAYLTVDNVAQLANAALNKALGEGAATITVVLDELSDIYANVYFDEFMTATLAIEISSIVDAASEIIKSLGLDETLVKPIADTAKLLVHGTVENVAINGNAHISEVIENVASLASLFLEEGSLINVVLEQAVVLTEGIELAKITEGLMNIKVDSVIDSIGEIAASFGLGSILVDPLLDTAHILLGGTIGATTINGNAHVSEIIENVASLASLFLEEGSLINVVLEQAVALTEGIELAKMTEGIMGIEIDNVIHAAAEIIKAYGFEEALINPVEQTAQLLLGGTIAAMTINGNAQISEVFVNIKALVGNFEIGDVKYLVNALLEQAAELTKGIELAKVNEGLMNLEISKIIAAAKNVTASIKGFNENFAFVYDTLGELLSGTVANMTINLNAILDKFDDNQKMMLVGGVAIGAIALYYVANPILVSIVNGAIGDTATWGDMLAAGMGYTLNGDSYEREDGLYNSLADYLFKLNVVESLDISFGLVDKLLEKGDLGDVLTFNQGIQANVEAMLTGATFTTDSDGNWALDNYPLDRLENFVLNTALINFKNNAHQLPGYLLHELDTFTVADIGGALFLQTYASGEVIPGFETQYTYNASTQKWTFTGTFAELFEVVMNCTVGDLTSVDERYGSSVAYMKGLMKKLVLGDVLSGMINISMQRLETPEIVISKDTETDKWTVTGKYAAVIERLANINVNELYEKMLTTEPVKYLFANEWLGGVRLGNLLDNGYNVYNEATGVWSNAEGEIAFEDNFSGAMLKKVYGLTLGDFLGESGFDVAKITEGMYLGEMLGYTCNAEAAGHEHTDTCVWFKAEDVKVGEAGSYTDDKKLLEAEALYAKLCSVSLDDIMDGTDFIASIKQLTLGELMGYKKVATTVGGTTTNVYYEFLKDGGKPVVEVTDGFAYRKAGAEVDKLTATLADISVDSFMGGSGVDDIMNKIEALKVGEILRYTYNETDSKWYNGTTEIGGLLSILCGYTLSEVKDESKLKEIVNEMTLGDVLGASADSNAILKKLKTKKVGELTDAIDETYVGEILGYTKQDVKVSATSGGEYDRYEDADGNAYYNDSTPDEDGTYPADWKNAENGAPATDIAKAKDAATGRYKVGAGDPAKYLFKVNDWVNGSVAVTGVQAILANFTIGELDDSDFDARVTSSINNRKLGELITINDDDALVLLSLKEVKVKDLSTKLNSMKFKEFMAINSSSPIILQQVADSTLDGLGATINAIEIGTLMGYEKDDSGVWKKDGTEIGELAGLLADFTVEGVSGANLETTLKDKIDGLHVSTIFGTKAEAGTVFSIFSDEDYDDLTVKNLSKKMEEQFKHLNLGNVADLGIIDIKFFETTNEAGVTTYTKLAQTLGEGAAWRSVDAGDFLNNLIQGYADSLV